MFPLLLHCSLFTFFVPAQAIGVDNLNVRQHGQVLVLKPLRSVRTIAREFDLVANRAFDAYREDRVMEEPQVTDRILGAIEVSIQNRQFGGVVWKARTLKTSGKGAEEKRHGADLMGVLDINLPFFKVKKGFLAQAKRAEPDGRFSLQEWKRLLFQCEKMLERTPDSFVWIYSKREGIRIFSANSVLGLGMTSRNVFDLYHHSVSSFFESHLECFIGDPLLNSTNIETLDTLADIPARRPSESLPAEESSLAGHS